MNSRERFANCLNYEEVDHVPDMEFGAWEDNFPIWQAQGMPDWVKSNHEFDDYFELETFAKVSPPMFINVWPTFETVVLEDKGETEVVKMRNGTVAEVPKEGGGESIPRYISFPVVTPDDWKQYKEEHYNIEYAGRWETTDEEWEEVGKQTREADKPVGVNCGGFYWFIRDVMGMEEASMAFAMEPDMVHDIMESRCEMVLKGLDKALQHCQIDYGSWGEDMCYNHGPLISPEMFKEFMLPRYKRITAKLKEHGIVLHVLDSDGDINSLAPLWLEAGINCLYPLEVAANANPMMLREKYGKDMRFKGHVNKMELVSHDRIDRELERLAPLVADGGYIPHVDHRVPPDITLENYRYYLQQKRKVLLGK